MSKRERDQEERGEGRRGGEEGIGEKQALNNSYLNSMVVTNPLTFATESPKL